MDQDYLTVGGRVIFYDPNKDKEKHGTIIEIVDGIVHVQFKKKVRIARVDVFDRCSDGKFDAYVDWDFRENCPYQDSPAF